MALLNELKPGALVKGLLPGGIVTIIDVKNYGDISLELIYKDSSGHLGTELLYGDSVAQLEIASNDLPWSFQADGTLFRLVSEAYRIRLAYLFDPLIAVHTSLVIPCHTRLLPSMRPCSQSSRYATYWPTTPAQAKPS